MSKIIFIIFLFLNPLFLYSQSDYWAQTNGPHGGTIHDYSFGGNDTVYAAADNGVYKSVDYGVTWSSIGFLGTQVWGICKTSSGALLAGDMNIGLYRTTNEGLNWTRVNFINTYIYDIKEINPNLIILASYYGVYKSTNDGLNWAQTLANVYATSIDTSSMSEIYVSTANSGIYKSTNNGSNWIQINGSNFGPAFSVNVAINGYIFITTSNGSIYRSTNNGLNFYDIGAPHQIYKTFMSVTTKDGYLYCGTFYQGIWSSSDFGDTWVKQYNGERYNFFVRKLCEGRNGDVFASVNYNGVIRTTDHGNLWNGFSFRSSYTPVEFLLKTNDGKILSNTSQTSFDNGLNWIYSDYDFQPISFGKNQINGFIYAADGSSDFPSGWIYVSVNNGDEWEKIIIDSTAGIYNVYTSGNGDVFANGGNIYKSTNNGIDWSEIPALYFYSVAVDSKGYIYGKRSDGLWRSTNDGLNWQTVLPINDTNAPTFITTSGDIYTPGNNTLFKSTNNGDNWTQENLTGPVSCIIENQNGRIFVSIYGSGVFMKAGDTWININYNLNNTNVTSLCFNETGQLLAGTTTGVFRTNASVIGIISISQNILDQFSLYQNYPNPFNPVTVIRYSLRKNSYTTLKIFDAAGKEVAILINEKLNAGTYEAKFDGSNLASGLYFYKLTSGDFNETKKMLLIK